MSQRLDKAYLALEDGTFHQGYLVGKAGTCGGELCFNTSMTGYQEIFTDPSYYGQLMMMTYPHIGNYGVHSAYDEARKPMVAGIITRAFSKEYSNLSAEDDLNSYLDDNGVTGITGVDTRSLVRHIRDKGVMNAVISSEIHSREKLVQMAKDWAPMEGLELATKATRTEAQTIAPADSKYRVAVIDYGIKQSIIKNLLNRNCTLRIFPAKTTWDEIQEWAADGFFLSNGPGDPRAITYTSDTVQNIMADPRPVFGICLGHQLMALSKGIEIIKMKVGHRGANQPVKNLNTTKVEITTQNHGFGVESGSVIANGAQISHINLNDNTVEGIVFPDSNAFSVQYHPEASPGPHDSRYLFDEFVKRLSER
ncbi:MAG: glutamine-hydrolyzing carbamoyl-phosphate synthase small subunit [Balneolales bacterium]|nr:glutamine-hydrolyzing carbamoyl-phosphate synthase small subunit [Balneolales bacterium]